MRIKIDDQWYDYVGWAKAHPGGERWIHFFDGRDGTDAFYALHSYGPNGSSKAADRLAKLPKCDPPPPVEDKTPTASEYATSMSFRDFRQKLEKDGFFERNVFQEAWKLTQVVGLYVAGQYFAYSNPGSPPFCSVSGWSRLAGSGTTTCTAAAPSATRSGTCPRS